MAVNPRISMLLDVYGSMLTPKERDALELYYNEDLSLSEIADNEASERAARADGERATISRQGVRDAIKRAENKLLDMEERLGLAEKSAEMRRVLAIISESAAQIRECNSRRGMVPDIDRLAERIAELAESLGDDA